MLKSMHTTHSFYIQLKLFIVIRCLSSVQSEDVSSSHNVIAELLSNQEKVEVKYYIICTDSSPLHSYLLSGC